MLFFCLFFLLPCCSARFNDLTAPELTGPVFGFEAARSFFFFLLMLR